MPVVVGGLILALLVMLLFGGTDLDRGLLFLFSARDHPGLEQVAGWIAWAAGPAPLLAVTLAATAILCMRRHWRDAVLLVAVTVGGRLLVEGVQGLTQEIRPALDATMVPGQDLAYPSRHAANATVTGLALAFLAVRRRPWRGRALAAAAAFALLVGAARLVLGASWPTDVIGGWALGLAWTLLLLKAAGEDLGNGTARPLRHSFPQGENHGRQSQDRNRPPE